MDSINQNTMTANNMNIHPQLQSNLQMRLPTSVQNGVQPIASQVNGSPKKLFQPPPPTSVTEPPADIEIDTESKKSLLEVNFPRIIGLSNGGDYSNLLFQTMITEDDLKIIYPYHEPKAAMESIFIDNVMWVGLFKHADSNQ